MAGNTNPIFAAKGLLPWSDNVTAANTTLDGASGTVNYIKFAGSAWAAGADGAFVVGLRFKGKGANAASLARVFINNGAAETTAANNCFLTEYLLPLTALSQTVPQPEIIVPFGFILPAGHRIFWTLATAVATGWQAVAICGDYAP